MRKDSDPDYLIGNDEGSRHQRAGLEFRWHRRSIRGILGAQRVVLANGLGEDSALHRFQPTSPEGRGQYAVSFGTNQFRGRKTTPEVDPIDTKELSRGLAKQAYELQGRRPVRRHLGEAQEQPLESIICAKAGLFQHRCIAGMHGQYATASELRNHK